tara:strand:+ start:313 stop:1020 length:708 start_codon:yes stop_codon:yes gene_type:complete
MANFVNPIEGERVLDVACGTGVVTKEIYKYVQPNGSVVGYDSNAEMLATASEISPTIHWREGDAMDLPFEDGRFDLVTCQQGYQFFPNRLKAAIEAYRVLNHAGRIGVSAWCSLSENPGQAAVVAAVEEHVNIDAAKIVGSAFGLGDESELKEIFSAAGFCELKLITETRPARFPSPEALVNGLLRGGALARLGVQLSDDVMAQIKRQVREVLKSYQTTGELVFPMSANLALARK